MGCPIKVPICCTSRSRMHRGCNIRTDVFAPELRDSRVQDMWRLAHHTTSMQDFDSLRQMIKGDSGKEKSYYTAEIEERHFACSQQHSVDTVHEYHEVPQHLCRHNVRKRALGNLGKLAEIHQRLLLCSRDFANGPTSRIAKPLGFGDTRHT